MAGVADLNGVLERFKQAGQEFVKGNPKPVQELFSTKQEVPRSSSGRLSSEAARPGTR